MINRPPFASSKLTPMSVTRACVGLSARSARDDFHRPTSKHNLAKLYYLLELWVDRRRGLEAGTSSFARELFHVSEVVRPRKVFVRTMFLSYRDVIRSATGRVHVAQDPCLILVNQVALLSEVVSTRQTLHSVL